MAETKIEIWKRKVANKRNKELLKEAQKTWDILKRKSKRVVRPLSANWTLEDMQSIQQDHGIDLEDEMAKALAAEIDKEILDGLCKHFKKN